MANRYTRRDFAAGPHFSLSLDLGFAGQDEQVMAALSTLYACPRVHGIWAEPQDVGTLDLRGFPSPYDAAQPPYGLLTIDAATPPIPFVLHVIRESRAENDRGSSIKFGIQTQAPSDWMTLGIPACMLATLWSVDHTWSVASQPWLAELCHALSGVADHVHAHAPILSGVMGEEASGCWRMPTPVRMGEAEQGYPPLAILTTQVIEERGGFVVTPELWHQLAPSTKPGGLIFRVVIRAAASRRSPNRRMSGREAVASTLQRGVISIWRLQKPAA